MKRSIIILIGLGVVAVGYVVLRGNGAPTASPSPSSTYTPTPVISRIVTPTRTPIPTGVGATPTLAPTPTQTVTPTPTSTNTPTPTPTVTITPTPSITSIPTPTPQSYTVLLQNHAFSPSTLTVTKGDQVIFQDVDAFYTVTIGSARSSSRLQPGQTWTLNSGDFAPGTYSMTETAYTYMRGTLTIQ